MSFARAVDNAIQNVSDFLRKPASSYCRLACSNDDQTLVADDGTLISFIELNGAIQLFGKQEFNRSLDSMVSTLSGYLKNRGHCLQFVIQSDPDSSLDELAVHYNPMKKSAKAMGINIDGIINDTMKKQARFTSSEHVFVVVWTYPYAMPPATVKKAAKKAAKRKRPQADRHTMSVYALEELQNNHSNFLNAVKNCFSKGNLWHKTLSSHESLWWVRRCIDPEVTGRGWKAVLPGDKFVPREMENGDTAVSAALPPSLRRQLFPRDANTDNSTTHIGNMIHQSFSMEMGPQHPQRFTSLFNELVQEPFPWRISFHITGDGLNGTGLKHTLSSVLGFTSSVNRQLNDSLKQLTELKKTTSIVRLEINFDTWVDLRRYKNEKDARDDLSTQYNYFVAAVQGWGTMDVAEIPGDPLLPFSATIPGLALKTPSNKPAAPIRAAFAMMPFTRPASPWETGSFILRSIDGKIFPVQMLSSLQPSWIECGGGGLGAGKSFWISSTNMAFVFQPGFDELPYLGIIDIGPSSSGFIKLLKTALPPQSQKYVAAHKLRMDPEYAVNPFDTPLGVRKPFESHYTWLLNLLCVFCTPLGKNEPPEGVEGLMRTVIDQVYERCAKIDPKIYTKNVDLELDDKVLDLDIPLDHATTWWEIVDAFFEKGMHHEATLAQRHAMPILRDLIPLCGDNNLRSLYNFKTSLDEHITDYVSRKLGEADTAYPIFNQATQFDLGEARIVSLDLNDVAPRGGAPQDRQSGVMYLLAMHLLSGAYFYTDEDAKPLPSPYREYHRQKIKKLRSLPKKLVLDEFHRATRTGSTMTQVIAMLETLSRESRKWLISLAFYSQILEDMPKVITDLSNTVYILSAGSTENQNHLVKKFELNSAGRNALKVLGSPDSRGANCLAIYKVKGGEVQQLVTNTVGGQMIWAFSTTREDQDVRDELYRRCDAQDVLEMLAQEHPGGIKDYVNAKRKEYADKGERVDVIQDCVEKIEAKIKERNARA